jgi:GDP-mannose 6-dehydrogenase
VHGKLIPLLNQYSSRQAGKDFGLCFNPEFLREGTAIKDYYHPGYIIIGEIDSHGGDLVEQMYQKVDASVTRTAIETAEMVKYTSNAFHAMKIVFANEIGNICKAHGVDGQDVMNILCQDHHLNISPTYLKPGFAFGGSCLPKDVRALVYRAKEKDVEVPVLNAIAISNQKQIEHAIDLIEEAGSNRIGILGLSFKPWTDDVRESPTVTMVETLIGRGYQVSVFDEKVDPDRLIGANKTFLERALPHIACLMRPSIKEVIEQAGVIVIANSSPLFCGVPACVREDQTLIDLTGTAKDNRQKIRGKYVGICWS